MNTTNTNTVQLSKETIDNVFESAEHQSDYLIGLYKVAVPDWDDIERVDGYPKISKVTNEYIFGKAIDFDKKYHPGVINGGLWMNSGFSQLDSENVEDWTIDMSEVNVVYKGEDKVMVSTEEVIECLRCGNCYHVELVAEGEDYNDFGDRYCPFCGLITDMYGNPYEGQNVVYKGE